MEKPHRDRTVPLIRLAHAHAFAEFLHQVGAPSERLFRRLGLPVCCDDPTVFVPLRQAWALFDTAARLVDPSLGWHVGRFCGDKRLNSGMLRKIENAPTLYQGLCSLVRLVSSEASHLELGILDRSDDIVFFTRYSTIKDWPGYMSSQAYQLAIFVDLIRQYAGSSWVPSEIGIESPTVPAFAEEHFPGARIRTNRQMGYLVIPRHYLHIPARTVLHGDTEQDPIVLARNFDFVDGLRAVVEAYMVDGYPSAQEMAARMDISPRTLFRRLGERRLTYQGLIDDVRFKIARKRLERSDETVHEIARSVGFTDPTHFSRMFRRIGGLSPTEYRRSVWA